MKTVSQGTGELTSFETPCSITRTLNSLRKEVSCVTYSAMLFFQKRKLPTFLAAFSAGMLVPVLIVLKIPFDIQRVAVR